jgi:hypothetical protein
LSDKKELESSLKFWSWENSKFPILFISKEDMKLEMFLK